MSSVRREDIIDFVTYEEQRGAIRAEALAVKAPRRIHVGPFLTFLFENAVTVRYQVLEMVRAERMVRDADIRREVETYNELLGGPGELGATLLIEIPDEAERNRFLRAWLELPQRIYARLEDGTRVAPVFDPRQIDEGKLSSVHYLRFPLGGRVPVALVCDLDGPAGEAVLDAEQRAALAADLAAD